MSEKFESSGRSFLGIWIVTEFIDRFCDPQSLCVNIIADSAELVVFVMHLENMISDQAMLLTIFIRRIIVVAIVIPISVFIFRLIVLLLMELIENISGVKRTVLGHQIYLIIGFNHDEEDSIIILTEFLCIENHFIIG